MTNNSSRLRSVLAFAEPELRALPREKVETPAAPGKWSPKQELGHLIDSGFNNHQRIARAQLEDDPSMPGYNQDEWVELHKYRERNWNEIIQIWRDCNLQLAAAADAVSKDGWSRKLSVGGSEPMTIRFLLDDYINHMLHHLEHIGLSVDQFRTDLK